MNDNTINTLSGAVALPAFDLLHGLMNLREIRRFYHGLCDLQRSDHANTAVTIIDVLIRLAGSELPGVYAEVIASPKLQAIFLDGFLADFEDIFERIRGVSVSSRYAWIK